jgi:hypothetical protein
MLKSINPQNDVVITEITVTNGFFGSSGTGTIAKNTLTTSSLSSTQKEYYYNLQYSSTDHFSVSYGHIAGSGSNADGSNEVGSTEAIYKGFYNLVEPSSAKLRDSAGWLMADGTDSTNNVTQSDCYFVVAERLQMKDRLNPGTWTIALSGSLKNGTAKTLNLTDNSVNNDPEAPGSPFGPRYSIRSGSAGTLYSSDTREYGKFYPDAGLVVLSANALSSSLPGKPAYQQTADSFATFVGVGLNPDTGSEDTNPNNAGKLAVCMISSSQTMRSEEQQYIYDYFCRARANEFNLTNNVTFWSGSQYKIRHNDMVSNPQTYLSEVGLYDTTGELMAIGRISSPLNKNFSSEAIVKVRLTY